MNDGKPANAERVWKEGRSWGRGECSEHPDCKRLESGVRNFWLVVFAALFCFGEYVVRFAVALYARCMSHALKVWLCCSLAIDAID